MAANYVVEVEEEEVPLGPDLRPRDALGRLKKQHRPRKDPLTFFDDDQFKRRYRLSKETVRELAAHYHQHSNTNGYGEGAGLTSAQRFCLALRYFATGAQMPLVGDFQGVDRSTVSRAVADVANFFYAQSHVYIKFPQTVMEQQRLAAGFYEKTGHPRCIGCIDGTHIPLKKPTINEGAFFNRKGWCSLNAMITCDADRNIIGLDAGWGGSVADAYCFNASELRREGDRGFLNDFFLLGDSGYPLKPYLFTPIPTPTTPAELAFNTWHRSTRATVEQTIGVLKQRFRCLDGSAGYICHEPEQAVRIVVACCCLHNMANATGAGIGVDVEGDEDAAAAHIIEHEQPEAGRVPQAHADVLAFRDIFIAQRF